MKILREKEAEDFLKKEGFDIVEGAVVRSKKELAGLRIQFPWAMKVISKKIVHKTRAGGVILGMKTAAEAEKSFEKLGALPGFEGVLVQRMMMGQGEFAILGLKDTPEFGLVIMVGSGGTKVEELDDVSFRVTPITGEDASEMLKEIKLRTRNEEELKKNLLRLSRLAEKYPKISELDINPIVITQDRGVIVDARMILK